MISPPSSTLLKIHFFIICCTIVAEVLFHSHLITEPLPTGIFIVVPIFVTEISEDR